MSAHPKWVLQGLLKLKRAPFADAAVDALQVPTFSFFAFFAPFLRFLRYLKLQIAHSTQSKTQVG
jgi:hypothetical protein